MKLNKRSSTHENRKTVSLKLNSSSRQNESFNPIELTSQHQGSFDYVKNKISGNAKQHARQLFKERLSHIFEKEHEEFETSQDNINALDDNSLIDEPIPISSKQYVSPLPLQSSLFSNNSNISNSSINLNELSMSMNSVSTILDKNMFQSQVFRTSLFSDDDNSLKPEFPQRKRLYWKSILGSDYDNDENEESKSISKQINKSKSDKNVEMDDISSQLESLDFNNDILQRSIYSSNGSRLASNTSESKESKDKLINSNSGQLNTKIDLLSPISPNIKHKYFGKSAKQHFYETYHEINKKSKVVVGGIQGIEDSLHEADIYNQNRMALNFSTNQSNKSSKLRIKSATTELLSDHQNSHTDSVQILHNNKFDRGVDYFDSSNNSVTDSYYDNTIESANNVFLDDDSHTVASWGIPFVKNNLNDSNNVNMSDNLTNAQSLLDADNSLLENSIHENEIKSIALDVDSKISANKTSANVKLPKLLTPTTINKSHVKNLAKRGTNSRNSLFNIKKSSNRSSRSSVRKRDVVLVLDRDVNRQSLRSNRSAVDSIRNINTSRSNITSDLHEVLQNNTSFDPSISQLSNDNALSSIMHADRFNDKYIDTYDHKYKYNSTNIENIDMSKVIDNELMNQENIVSERSDVSLDEVNQSSYSPNSPRAMFILHTMRLNLPPRAIVMLRDKFTTVLDLSYLGLGNKLIKILAEAISSLPLLEVIILRDNNAFDDGLEAIVKSISRLHNIVELDISSNKVGSKTATALGEYIGQSFCSLVGLKLSDCSIQDEECVLLVHNLMLNSTLLDLDLSNNNLGKDESNRKSTTKVSAGESLSRLLVSGFCPIRKLNIHWNLIRLDGAVQLCNSLRHTKSLIYLNLSYNSIGQRAATEIGAALLENQGLEELILCSNSIDEVGCFTIVSGAKEHQTLKYLDLSGNAIGEEGGRSLMKLAKYHGNRIKFNTASCDLTYRMPEIMFRANDPIIPTTDEHDDDSSCYFLDLSIPYHRAVAIEILDIVAFTPTLYLKKFEISSDASIPFDANNYWKRPKSGIKKGKDRDAIRSMKFQTIKLKKFLKSTKPYSESLSATVKLLRAIVTISEDKQLIRKVFQTFDVDNSGELDSREFKSLLINLGFENIDGIMSTIDNDGDDLINLDECTEYIFNIGNAARAHLREIEFNPMFSLVEGGNESKYIVPSKGVMKIDVSESLKDTTLLGCLTKQQCKLLIEAASQSSDPKIMLQYAMDLSTLYLDEAQMIFTFLKQFEDVKEKLLATIIPRMASTVDANSFVKIHLGNDTKAYRHLKKSMGSSYNPLLGIYSGFYHLDLINPADRACLYKLLCHSIQSSAYRQSNNKYDISQNGNWNTCFRNIRKNGELVSMLQADKFSPMPKDVKLEFDFIDTSRPNFDINRNISYSKFYHLLYSCGLLNKQDIKVYEHYAQSLVWNQRNSLGEINSSHAFEWSIDANRMQNIFESLQIMYNSSDVRYESYEKSAKKEVYVTATFADLQFNARASMSGAMKTLQAVKAFKNQMNSGASGIIKLLGQSNTRASFVGDPSNPSINNSSIIGGSGNISRIENSSANSPSAAATGISESKNVVNKIGLVDNLTAINKDRRSSMSKRRLSLFQRRQSAFDNHELNNLPVNVSTSNSVAVTPHNKNSDQNFDHFTKVTPSLSPHTTNTLISAGLMLPPLTIDNPPVVVDTSVSVMPNINSKASNQNHSIAHNSSTEALNGLKQDTTQYAPGINKARHGSLFKAIPVLLVEEVDDLIRSMEENDEDDESNHSTDTDDDHNIHGSNDANDQFMKKLRLKRSSKQYKSKNANNTIDNPKLEEIDTDAMQVDDSKNMIGLTSRQNSGIAQVSANAIVTVVKKSPRYSQEARSRFKNIIRKVTAINKSVKVFHEVAKTSPLRELISGKFSFSSVASPPKPLKSQIERDIQKKIHQVEVMRTRFVAVLRDSRATNEYKSNMILAYLINQLAPKWITSVQMIILLQLFSIGFVPKSSYGSYRVELLVVMFSRIIDIHNINQVLRVLTSEEHAAIIARVGWLLLFNPCKPDGCYRFDLSKWEERQTAKMLIHLAVTEPGLKLHDEEFTFANQDIPMPGFKITKNWYEEKGFSDKGTLQLRYDSGDGMGLLDCKPDIYLRRLLLQLVLIDISDVESDLKAIFDENATAARRRSSVMVAPVGSGIGRRYSILQHSRPNNNSDSLVNSSRKSSDEFPPIDEEMISRDNEFHPSKHFHPYQLSHSLIDTRVYPEYSAPDSDSSNSKVERNRSSSFKSPYASPNRERARSSSFRSPISPLPNISNHHSGAGAHSSPTGLHSPTHPNNISYYAGRLGFSRPVTSVLSPRSLDITVHDDELAEKNEKLILSYVYKQLQYFNKRKFLLSDIQDHLNNKTPLTFTYFTATNSSAGNSSNTVTSKISKQK